MFFKLSALVKLSCVTFLVIPVTAGPVTPDVSTLSVVVSGPDTVTDAKNLHLNVTVTNTGQRSLKLINYPWSPLSTSPTDSFLISGPNQVSPDFSGIAVKYAGIDYVAAKGQDDAFTVLAAGQSVVLTHDLSKGYNFKNSGLGKYTIDTLGSFYHVDDSKRVVSIKATTKSHQLMLNGNIPAFDPSPDMLTEFATFVNCTPAQQNQINQAINAARGYVAESIRYINNHTVATPRFTTWFGAFQNARHTTVLSHFNSLARRGNEFTAWKYTCNPSNCQPGYFAYVYREIYGEVYLCGAFWRAPASGTDSQAGTLVHEGTHFSATANTDDIAYGQPASRELARTDPDRAISVGIR
ncbi:hypothetical protein BDZ94DRAFT_1285995 [Collybia nuda]|uniref:Lysine-specific metallo-endopeptidase domain-containing protein n=1 Tax=Collybia nuda TaxID=64659 RepID=A0A9P6C8D7_9AGAR|nr:hypothetical protein BDZ94DRAFT_1285995 [Collybia nuda]